MEAELDATLVYEKNHKGDLQTDNKRNGHSTKNLKSQYGEFQIDVPRDRNGEFEPKLIPKYPYAISNWENNWEDISSFFQFSNDIRRIMYTTNIIVDLIFPALLDNCKFLHFLLQHQ